MINPTPDDVGRAVVYQVAVNWPKEDGVITRITEDSIFVRYKDQHPASDGKMTSREDLEWLTMKPKPCDGNHCAPECKDIGCWHRCQNCKKYWVDGECCPEGKI